MPLHHFSSHVPRCQCIACGLAPFTFTATFSLFTAAVVAPDAAIDAAESLCQSETFYFALSLSRHSIFSRPILACAHSRLRLLCAAVLHSCYTACAALLSALKPALQLQHTSPPSSARRQPVSALLSSSPFLCDKGGRSIRIRDKKWATRAATTSRRNSNSSRHRRRNGRAPSAHRQSW